MFNKSILIFNKNFNFGMNWNFSSSEWQVQGPVRNLNLSNCKAALVISTSDIQWFTVGCMAPIDGERWNTSCGWIGLHPRDMTKAQHLKLIFANLFATIAHIAGTLCWQHFGGQQIPYNLKHTQFIQCFQMLKC